MTSGHDVYACFLEPAALEINLARNEHLLSLGFDWRNKRVLEVGAGIGLHTDTLVDQGAIVLSIDGRAENIAELLRRFPERRASVADLEIEKDILSLGTFDIVHAYGVLYHLSRPELSIASLSKICREYMVIETCVDPGAGVNCAACEEGQDSNQALRGIGCRPTRLWVMEKLQMHFGHAYTTTEQPNHPDFIDDWQCLPLQKLFRAVFVASKNPINNSKLVATLPSYQPVFSRGLSH